MIISVITFTVTAHSSAFNTMQPHILISRLAEYNIPARLHLLVLDFLTNRQQYVWTECEISSTIAINTGTPQGCVLSAFVSIVYTNALSLSSENCKIKKYAGDTVVIGLISDNNKEEYKSTIDYVSHWCADHFLDLNASKTNEIIFDMRKNKNSKEPVIINNTSVALVQSYKYLGATIHENLKWNELEIHHLNQGQTLNSKHMILFFWLLYTLTYFLYSSTTVYNYANTSMNILVHRIGIHKLIFY